VGADHVLWASDFPHPDAIFPGAPAAIVANAAAVGMVPEDVRSILWETPASFYRVGNRF
jgi:predicted TIM-barrel fold metal-dependent hydrolase